LIVISRFHFELNYATSCSHAKKILIDDLARVLDVLGGFNLALEDAQAGIG
jgi:hypothetical protein